MNFAGEVHRALPVDGVPPGRVGHTCILNLQADAHGRLVRRQPDDARRRLPSGPAGCAAPHFNGGDPSVDRRNLKFRASELTPIPSQTILPGQTASGGRRYGEWNFLAGSHQRNILVVRHARQVGR